MARTLMAHSPFKVLCLWKLYVAHGPLQLEFQSNQPKCSLSPTLCALHEI